MSFARRTVGSCSLVVALLLAPLSNVNPAGAAMQRASSGEVSATFTYSGSYPEARNPHLTISRSGTVLYSRLVTSSWCARQCWPDAISPRQSALHVVRFEPHGPPAVVLDLYSGGAHCCSLEQVYATTSASTMVTKTEYNFGDPGARLVRFGPSGTFDFLSADDAFAYAFTDYAASGMPIRVMSFSNNSFHDVTRSFSKLIARDALEWMRVFNDSKSSGYQDTVGLVAAWAADEDMLGHFSLTQRFLRTQLKAGHLNSALSPIEPGGQRFVSALQKFLKDHHYVK